LILLVHPESGYRIKESKKAPDPGVKKAPHPESGSATLVATVKNE
jgi:hypothetical protein